MCCREPPPWKCATGFGGVAFVIGIVCLIVALAKKSQDCMMTRHDVATYKQGGSRSGGYYETTWYCNLDFGENGSHEIEMRPKLHYQNQADIGGDNTGVFTGAICNIDYVFLQGFGRWPLETRKILIVGSVFLSAGTALGILFGCLLELCSA